MSRALQDLAESHGIQVEYTSEMGEPVRISDAAVHSLLGALGVDPDTGAKGSFAEAHHTPERACALPATVKGQRRWGVACQLYGLRSARNLGLGDFTDLADLAVTAAREGASFVGVNPLHALFMADAGRFSPYSPSTRSFLNPLYIAIDRLDGGDGVLAALRRESPELFDALDGALVALNHFSCRLAKRIPLGFVAEQIVDRRLKSGFIVHLNRGVISEKLGCDFREISHVRP